MIHSIHILTSRHGMRREGNENMKYSGTCSMLPEEN